MVTAGHGKKGPAVMAGQSWGTGGGLQDTQDLDPQAGPLYAFPLGQCDDAGRTHGSHNSTVWGPDLLEMASGKAETSGSEVSPFSLWYHSFITTPIHGHKLLRTQRFGSSGIFKKGSAGSFCLYLTLP